MQNYLLESKQIFHIAGVDEVGVGPIAGPVVAAAVMFGQEIPRDLACLLDDSKKIKSSIREQIYERLKILPKIQIGIAAASVHEITHLNIRNATFLAMQRAVQKLSPKPKLIFIDGKFAPDFECITHAIIKGDGLSFSIAAASIIAKVTRDRLMQRLSRKWTQYGWEQNAGYPTLNHRQALERYGICPHHRQSFLSIKQLSFEICQFKYGAVKMPNSL